MSTVTRKGKGYLVVIVLFCKNFARITSTRVLALLTNVMVSKSWNEIENTLIVE